MGTYPTFPTDMFGVNNNILVLTSDIGYRPSKRRMHYGIDINFVVGTPIYSPYPGKATVKLEVGKKGGKDVPKGWGLYIDVKYQDLTVRFAHLSKSEIGPVGTTRDVRAGTLLGLTGGKAGLVNSGNSGGPHLHLEVRQGNTALDPKPFFAQYTLKRGGKVLQAGNLNNRTVAPTDIKPVTSNAPSATQRMTPYEITHSDVEREEEEKPATPTTTAQGRFAPGIWQIVKLLMDSSVQQKQIVNSSIATQTGSLMNFVNKVCQKPMVEFFGDTYGSQYYFFARRPPFDKEGFLRMMNNGGMVSVSYKDVVSSNLDWNNQEIYSWYQYRPYADVLGSQITSLYFPSLFFPQFASIWGSKPLVIDSNYYNYIKSGRFNSTGESNSVNDANRDNANVIMCNAIKDFKYIIECNAYNAFTRRGTITLRGNRQFKRGTALYYEPTNEVFYINSVTQDFSVTAGGVTRNTVVEVIKGLVWDYIEGIEIETKVSKTKKLVSYFNIIDFNDFDNNIKKVTAENFTSFLKTWAVNLDVFDYFISKSQFVNYGGN